MCMQSSQQRGMPPRWWHRVLSCMQLFVYSLAVSTGLEPPLSAVSPYALVLANINALVAQLVLVFLTGAVFARLTQPSNPVRCAEVLIVIPALGNQAVAATSGTGFATHAPILIAKRPSDVDAIAAAFSSSLPTGPGQVSRLGQLADGAQPAGASVPGSPLPLTKTQTGNGSAFAGYRMLVGRYVLSGPQPCELVDVKIELSFRYTTVTPTGSFFRAVESLELVGEGMGIGRGWGTWSRIGRTERRAG